VSAGLTKADIESLAIDWFRSLGYDCALGSEILPGGARPLREAVTEPALAACLRTAVPPPRRSLFSPSWVGAGFGLF
jgi:hypothetical protein